MTESQSQSQAGTPAQPPTRILVWDAPVRVFHWLLVASFAGAWITAESERWRLVHVTLGYTVAALVAFRLLWGLLGTRHARFTDFVRGPGAVLRYLRSLLRREPEHHVGHNPAGALAILLLLAGLVTASASGWATYNDVGGEWLEDLHEGAANFTLAVVFVHVAGVVVSSWLHRENLVGSMISGRKFGPAGDAIGAAWRSVAAAMVVAVLAFWTLQWSSAPTGDLAAQAGSESAAKAERHAGHGRRDRDHDHD